MTAQLFTLQPRQYRTNRVLHVPGADVVPLTEYRSFNARLDDHCRQAGVYEDRAFNILTFGFDLAAIWAAHIASFGGLHESHRGDNQCATLPPPQGEPSPNSPAPTDAA